LVYEDFGKFVTTRQRRWAGRIRILKFLFLPMGVNSFKYLKEKICAFYSKYFYFMQKMDSNIDFPRMAPIFLAENL
jgi:hypothetical protein